MHKEEMPKKILIIKDCTFILPDNFDGNLEDAFREFLKYEAENVSKARFYDENSLFSTLDILLHERKNARVCGQYTIYELIDEQYKAIRGTGPNIQI